MTDIAYDLEFLDDGRTIELISIGLVSDDGREYYAVSSEAPWDRIKKHDWLMRNVVPHLPVTGRRSLDAYVANPPNRYPRPPIDLVGPDLTDNRVKPRQVIANEVRDFLQATDEVELWADYGAYDHVCLAQLWGPMISLPDGIPMYTNDIQQEARRQGLSWNDLPKQQDGVHDALADARHVQTLRRWLTERAAA